MNPISNFRLSPDIVLGREEHKRLLLLALAGTGHSADEADGLLYELDRAMTVPDVAVPRDVVRMGSTIRYRTGSGDARTVELVFPKQADIGAGRISVLTPVGAALIGLRQGQSITYSSRDGRLQSLTVIEVAKPHFENDDPDPTAA